MTPLNFDQDDYRECECDPEQEYNETCTYLEDLTIYEDKGNVYESMDN
jgi:hypothetical protein